MNQMKQVEMLMDCIIQFVSIFYRGVCPIKNTQKVGTSVR